MAEFSVCHIIKFKLFSRKVKEQYFALCITKYNPLDELEIYDKKTFDITEVQQIFRDFVVNGNIPDLREWRYTLIG